MTPRRCAAGQHVYALTAPEGGAQRALRWAVRRDGIEWCDESDHATGNGVWLRWDGGEREATIVRWRQDTGQEGDGDRGGGGD